MNDFALFWYEINSISARNVLLKMYGMSYSRYLSTEHWAQFSEAAKEHNDYTCQNCGVFSVYSSKCKPSTLLRSIRPFLVQLEVHHDNYFSLGQEQFKDVLVICRECHELTHSIIEDFMLETSLKMGQYGRQRT